MNADRQLKIKEFFNLDPAAITSVAVLIKKYEIPGRVLRSVDPGFQLQI